MALEPGSLAFFDGVLSGISNGKSYYLKEDLILELLSHLRQREPVFAKYFSAENVLEDYGYPFGTVVDLARAAKSCHLLTAPGPQVESNRPDWAFRLNGAQPANRSWWPRTTCSLRRPVLGWPVAGHRAGMRGRARYAARRAGRDDRVRNSACRLLVARVASRENPVAASGGGAGFAGCQGCWRACNCTRGRAAAVPPRSAQRRSDRRGGAPAPAPARTRPRA